MCKFTVPRDVVEMCEARVKRSAFGCERRGRVLPFTLSGGQLVGQWIKQEGRCALTGVKMTVGQGGSRLFKASLDRINSDRGYVFGNVQWTCWAANQMKGNGTDDEIDVFVDACIDAFMEQAGLPHRAADYRIKV